MNLLPSINEQEKIFIREVISGNTRTDAWRMAYDREEKIGPVVVSKKAEKLFKRKNIQIWIQFLQNSTPEEVIEAKYLENVAFGSSKDALSAAGAYLDSKFAGKEVGEIFWNTLKDIHAEIRVYCGRHKELESTEL